MPDITVVRLPHGYWPPKDERGKRFAPLAAVIRCLATTINKKEDKDTLLGC